MDPGRFEELVSDVLDNLPEWVHDAMDNVAIGVEARNPDEPDLLGLYEGTALTGRGEYGLAGDGLLPLPDVIVIYRDAILDLCDTEAEVAEEVRVTVIHEVAHHFGIDDERLKELGWA